MTAQVQARFDGYYHSMVVVRTLSQGAPEDYGVGAGSPNGLFLTTKAVPPAFNLDDLSRKHASGPDLFSEWEPDTHTQLYTCHHHVSGALTPGPKQNPVYSNTPEPLPVFSAPSMAPQPSSSSDLSCTPPPPAHQWGPPTPPFKCLKLMFFSPSVPQSQLLLLPLAWLWHHPLTVPPLLPSYSSVGPCMAASTIFLKMPFPCLKTIKVSQCSCNKNAYSMCGQQDPSWSLCA